MLVAERKPIADATATEKKPAHRRYWSTIDGVILLVCLFVVSIITFVFRFFFQAGEAVATPPPTGLYRTCAYRSAHLPVVFGIGKGKGVDRAKTAHHDLLYVKSFLYGGLGKALEGHSLRKRFELVFGQYVDMQVFIIKNYRSEEHTSELQSLMRISYAVFCLKKKNIKLPKLQSQQ